MSTLIMAACWPLQMSPTQKAVLISLADQANDQGVCWPAISTIGDRTCLSERAVRNALRDLESAGLIESQHRGGTSSCYVITPRHDVPPRHEMPPRQEVPPTPARGAPHPGTTCRSPRHDVPPNRKEPSENRKGTKSKGADAPLVVVPDWIPGEAWSDFVSHRKSIRKPLTPKAAELAIRTLDELRAKGQHPTAVIEQSIAAGWTGLFPLKTNPGVAHETPGRLSAADRVRANCRRSEERELAEHGFIRP
jgi:hypothetical protein